MNQNDACKQNVPICKMFHFCVTLRTHAKTKFSFLCTIGLSNSPGGVHIIITTNNINATIWSDIYDVNIRMYPDTCSERPDV